MVDLITALRNKKETPEKDTSRLVSVLKNRNNTSLNLESKIASMSEEEKELVLNLSQAPEIVNLLGVVMGQEAFDYFKQYEDESLTLQIIPKTTIAQPDMEVQQPEVIPLEAEPSQEATLPLADPSPL